MNFLAGSRGSILVILCGAKALVMACRLCGSGVRVDDQRYWGKSRLEDRGDRRARLSNTTKRVARGESSRVPEHEKTVVVPSDHPAPGIGLKRRGSCRAPSHRRVGILQVGARNGTENTF